MFSDLPAKIMAAIKAGFLDPLAAAPENLFHWLMGFIAAVPTWFWAGVLVATVAYYLMGRWAAMIAAFAGGLWIMAQFGS